MKNSNLRWFLLAAGFVLTLLSVTAAASFAQSAETDGMASIDNEAYELEVIRLTNLERTSRGLPPLKRNGDLTDAARAHNLDMITNDFFSHTGSDGSSSSVRACREGFLPYGWGSCYVGENIAAGYTTPADVVTGWMNSSGHRANILNPDYREIGLGHNVSDSGGNYWTMPLGAQPDVLPVFVNNDAAETTTRNVTVTLTKEDVSNWGSIGAITGVKISEDPTFGGAAWQSWAQTKSLTLSSGNGMKTVYVRFTDGTHEVNSSDTIVLNEPVPVLSVSPPTVTFLSELGSGQTIPLTAGILVANVGGDVLNWTADSNQSWLLLASDSGTAPDAIPVTISNSGGILNSLGSKTAVMTVTATNPDAQNTPQTVSISVLVVDTVHATYLPAILR